MSVLGTSARSCKSLTQEVLAEENGLGPFERLLDAVIPLNFGSL